MGRGGRPRRGPAPPARRLVALLIASLVLALAPALTIPAITVAVRADGGAPNLVYVTGAGAHGDQLAIVDIGKRQVVADVPVGAGGSAVALSTDARSAYVVNTRSGQLTIVDTRSHKVSANIHVGVGASSLVLDLIHLPYHLFVASSGSDSVSVVDPDARKVIATVPVGRAPTAVAIVYSGNGFQAGNTPDAEVYVANILSKSLTVISASTFQVKATIPLPDVPVGIVIPGLGGVGYVSTLDGSVLAVNLATHQLLGPVYTFRGTPGAMDYDAVTGDIYVPYAAAGMVAVLRPAAVPAAGAAFTPPQEPVRTLAFTGDPAAVAITFDGALGFVAQYHNGSVAMFDGATHKQLATIAVGGAPAALVTGAYPPALAPQIADTLGYVLGAVALAALVAAGSFAYLRRRATKPATHEDTA